MSSGFLSSPSPLSTAVRAICVEIADPPPGKSRRGGEETLGIACLTHPQSNSAHVVGASGMRFQGVNCPSTPVTSLSHFRREGQFAPHRKPLLPQPSKRRSEEIKIFYFFILFRLLGAEVRGFLEDGGVFPRPTRVWERIIGRARDPLPDPHISLAHPTHKTTTWRVISAGLVLARAPSNPAAIEGGEWSVDEKVNR